MFWSLLNKPPPALSSLSTWQVTGRNVLSDRPQGSGVHLGFAITGAMLSAGLFARAQRMVGSPGPCAGATCFSKIAAPLNTRLFIFKTFQAVQFFFPSHSFYLGSELWSKSPQAPDVYRAF